MAIAEVIKFEGSPDALVWKYPIEDFNATSQLIVDETHEALLVVNGNAADLFIPGRHTLDLPNIPLVRKLIEIPTGGDSPFPCKVFFINKVHHLDLKWGTQETIDLEDPLYDIFMHVMARGSMSVSVADSRKFMLKLVGFRDNFSSVDIVTQFRGIISAHVKDCVSKIMINGKLSYFMMNANLFELAQVIKERLDQIFDEYGINVEHFNFESIKVPDDDYREISEAKKRRTGRLIEGYTWQEEREMLIAEKFASNEGTMGNVGGAVGGFMMGGAMGSSFVDIARNALDPSKIPTEKPPIDGHGNKTLDDRKTPVTNVLDFFKPKESKKEGDVIPASPPVTPAAINADIIDDKVKCPHCQQFVSKGKFCSQCGSALPALPVFCRNCGHQLENGAKFCSECGTAQ